MSSPVLVAPARKPAATSTHNYLLLAGGYFSLAFAIFQLTAIWWPPAAVRYLGGPAEMSAQKPILYSALCVFFAAIVAIFGLYALSGAGQIRRLPLLRTGLIIITVIFLLRGLLAIPQIPMVIKHPHLLRFLIFSVVSLVVAALYGCGVVQLYRDGRPGEGDSR